VLDRFLALDPWKIFLVLSPIAAILLWMAKNSARK
jgi:hypothetical protein